MKIKTTIITIFLCIMLVTDATAAVFYTRSSSSIYNSDGVSQSKSVISSPLGGNIDFSSYGNLGKSEDMYSGAIYDGENIWLVPYGSDKLAVYTPAGDVKTQSLSASGFHSGYFGGTFDGSNIFLAPYEAPSILQINRETGKVDTIEYDKGANKYKGAVFDGEFTWFIPSDGKSVLCMDSLGEIKPYEIPFDIPEQNAFCGAVLASERIYFVPDKCDFVLILDRNTGQFRKLEGTPKITDCGGGIFEGDFVYFIPKSSRSLTRVAYATGEVNQIPLPDALPSTSAFSGGAFDGRYIWFSPTSGATALKYDIYSGDFTSYALESPEGTYISGAFDGSRVWLAPLSAVSPLVIGGSNTPPLAMDIFLTTTTDASVSSELSASDADEGDTITFEITQHPQYGTVTADTATGKFTYTPTSGTGDDFFLYRASDGTDSSNTAKVSITITGSEATQTGKYVDLWGHWAEEAANSLTQQGVFLGESVDKLYYFYPDYTLTRGYFTVLANSAFGFEGSMNDDTLPFEDLQGADKWIVRAASGAYQGKMLSGSLEDGMLYFKADEPLTRVEAMTMIYNVVHPQDADDEILDYEDRDSFPAWSIKILKSLKRSGMLKGYDDKTVRPYNKVTRAEAVQLLYETLNMMNTQPKTRERLK